MKRSTFPQIARAYTRKFLVGHLTDARRPAASESREAIATAAAAITVSDGKPYYGHLADIVGEHLEATGGACLLQT